MLPLKPRSNTHHELCLAFLLSTGAGIIFGVTTISVSDDGHGVSEKEKEALGQRGRRLDEQMPGHGLGFAIVVDIVKRYNGNIYFLEAANKGLKVRVDIAIEGLDG